MASNENIGLSCREIQLLSTGNEMLWGMDEFPLHSILILASKRHLWFRVCSSISIRRPRCLAIVSKVSAVHESKGRPLMEVHPRNREKNLCRLHSSACDVCLDRLCLLSRRLHPLRQLGLHHLANGKRKELMYHQWE